MTTSRFRSKKADTDRPQPTVGTNTDNRPTSLGHRSKFLDGLTQDPRSRSSEGMTERDTAAVGVHAVAWKGTERMFHSCLFPNEVFIFQALDVAQHLCRKRFMDFPQSDVVKS